ncbi:MAG: hypothetical protein ACJ74O_06200 [Frankiaceae bacterium]
MELFDAVTIARLQKRYRHWTLDQRPKLWHVALSDQYEQLRAWLRGEVAALASGADRLVPKLHDAGSFPNAFHELCVASLLRVSGRAIGYEPDLEGMTPDLVAHSPAQSDRLLLAEVWTRNRPREAVARGRQWLALKARFEQIPVPVRLVVVEGPGERPAPADSALSKQIYQSVRQWLLSPLTQRSSVHHVEGYTFAIVGHAAGLQVEFAAPGGAGAVASADQLLGAIAVKVNRYCQAVTRHDAELLVVTGAAEGTALSEDLLRSTLAGRNVVSMAFTAADIGTLGEVTTQMRANEDPPALDPALSAVAWLDADYDKPPGRLSIYRNPAAARPFQDLRSEGVSIEP